MQQLESPKNSSAKGCLRWPIMRANEWCKHEKSCTFFCNIIHLWSDKKKESTGSKQNASFNTFIMTHNGRSTQSSFFLSNCRQATYTSFYNTIVNQPCSTISLRLIKVLMLTNQNGGFYEYGHHYSLTKKSNVVLTFLELKDKHLPYIHQFARLPDGEN
jgi:hypothetical protein